MASNGNNSRCATYDSTDDTGKKTYNVSNMCIDETQCNHTMTFFNLQTYLNCTVDKKGAEKLVVMMTAAIGLSIYSLI